MGSTFNPQPKETQPLADTSNEQDTAPVTASADPLSVRRSWLPRAGKQGGTSQPVRDPDKEMGGPDRTNTVRGPPGSGEQVFPRLFPSGTVELTKRALHNLRCDACHQRGHGSVDCPWQARQTCMFCGSSSHTRGVECETSQQFSKAKKHKIPGELWYFPRPIKNEGPRLAPQFSTATRTLVSRPFT